jgi:Tfp pilus assembly protein PilE
VKCGHGGGAAALVPIVMVVVIAVMGAVAIPAYKSYQQRTQEAAAMQAVVSGLEQGASDTAHDAEAPAVNPAGRASTPSDH